MLMNPAKEEFEFDIVSFFYGTDQKTYMEAADCEKSTPKSNKVRGQSLTSNFGELSNLTSLGLTDQRAAKDLAASSSRPPQQTL